MTQTDLRPDDLQLAATPSARYFVSRLLGAFMRHHPGFSIALQIHDREALIGRLGANRDDLYLFDHLPEGREVVVQAIDSRWHFVTSAGRTPSAATQAFLDFARMEGKSRVR